MRPSKHFFLTGSCALPSYVVHFTFETPTRTSTAVPAYENYFNSSNLTEFEENIEQIILNYTTCEGVARVNRSENGNFILKFTFRRTLCDRPPSMFGIPSIVHNRNFTHPFGAFQQIICDLGVRVSIHRHDGNI